LIAKPVAHAYVIGKEYSRIKKKKLI